MSRRVVRVGAVVAAVVLIVTGRVEPSAASPVPVSLACTFVGTNPPVNSTVDAIVTVTAPTTVAVGDTFDATFLVEVPSFSPTPYPLADLTITSSFSVSGPVTPSGPLVFTQGPTDYAAGATIVAQVFVQTFTATGTGMVDFTFEDEDWTYALATADCTPSNGPLIAARTQVEPAEVVTTTTTPATTTSAVPSTAASTTPRFTG